MRNKCPHCGWKIYAQPQNGFYNHPAYSEVNAAIAVKVKELESLAKVRGGLKQAKETVVMGVLITLNRQRREIEENLEI